jgi:phasin family protein
MNNNFNMFGEGMKDFMNPENFTKHFKAMPTCDLSQISESVKKNSEAFTEAAQVASESAQAIMRRGAEIVQDNASHLFNSMKEVASSGNPEHAANRQQQFVQNFMLQAVSNTKELMDMSSKAVMEVFEKMSHHTNNNISTCMAGVNKTKKA